LWAPCVAVPRFCHRNCSEKTSPSLVAASPGMAGGGTSCRCRWRQWSEAVRQRGTIGVVGGDAAAQQPHGGGARHGAAGASPGTGTQLRRLQGCGLGGEVLPPMPDAETAVQVFADFDAAAGQAARAAWWQQLQAMFA